MKRGRKPKLMDSKPPRPAAFYIGWIREPDTGLYRIWRSDDPGDLFDRVDEKKFLEAKAGCETLGIRFEEIVD